MSKILIILTIIFSSMIIPHAYACQCLEPAPTEQFLEESEYAFLGTVTEIDNSVGPQMVLFDVELDIKGNIEGDKFLLTNTQLIRNPDGGFVTSCDAGFVVNGTYHVFVIDGTADMCTAQLTETFVMTPIKPTTFNFTPIIFITIGIVAFSLYIWKKRQ